MRRLFALIFALMLCFAPALAEDTATVEDCQLTAGAEVEIRYYLPQTAEASLALLDERGQEVMQIFSPRMLVGGRHVLRLEASFFAQLPQPACYTLALKTPAGMATAAFMAGEVTAPASAAAPAPAAQSDITPALRSAYHPQHENCYWCTPMNIADEAAVWAMLTAPITVVNIDEKSQAKLYAEPSASSAAVADVTGQSQALHVLETLDNGWTLVETYSSSFHDSSVRQWNAFATGYIQSNKLKTVQVNQEYGIVVDKLTQRLYLFKDGRLETSLAVSTGLYNSKQPYNETRSGEFMLISFTAQIKSDNTVGDFAIRYNADDYVHEVLYTPNNNGLKKNYGYCEPKLNARASHGCIRVQRRTNGDGYCMSNLYELLKESTRRTKLNVKFVIWEDYQGRQAAYPADDTLLYYNPNGGRDYHCNANCQGVNAQFLPLTAFTYGELETGAYARLNRCIYCQPALRKAEIDQINQEHRERSPGEIMAIIAGK